MENLSFEQALNQLECVVEAMEGYETTLEDSIKLYKEGIVLSKHCADILSRFEAEVAQLQKEVGGSFTEKTFEEAEGESGTANA